MPGPHIAVVYLTLLGSESSRGHCPALGHSKVVRTKERDPIQAGQQGASDRYPAAAHIHQTHLHPFRPRRAASRFRTRTEAPPTYLRVKQAESYFSTLARVQRQRMIVREFHGVRRKTARTLYPTDSGRDVLTIALCFIIRTARLHTAARLISPARLKKSNTRNPGVTPHAHTHTLSQGRAGDREARLHLGHCSVVEGADRCRAPCAGAAHCRSVLDVVGI